MNLGTIVIENIYEIDVLNSVPSHEVMESLSISNSFNSGWARCQNQGKMYGDNFITYLKDCIAEFFERGECGKGAKMTAEIMEVELQRRYPDDYVIP